MLLKNEKYRGALIRARTRSFFHSYPTRRSRCDERQSAIVKEIIEITYKGIRYTDSADIAGAFHAHCNRLFGGSNVMGQELGFHSLIGALPRLADDECAGVSGHITLGEVLIAISSLKTNKTPGPDGLSREFDQKFSDILAPVLLDIFIAAYDHGVLKLQPITAL